MPPLDLDRLLTNQAYLRRLARALVHDPDAADDLAQDALVVALERPPKTDASLRGWLASVVRTLAIDSARANAARTRREALAARSEQVPSHEDVVLRLDLSRHVAGALRALDEPYRSALYLRYVEELEPSVIAEGLGVPLATVKTRLRRGLELLRTRLDRELGERRAWSALLAPLAAPASTSVSKAALGAGGILVGNYIKLGAALALALAAFVLWPRPVQVQTVDASRPETARGIELADPNASKGASETAQRAAVSKAPSMSADAAVRKPGTLSARVLDEHRFPVQGAHVTLFVPKLAHAEALTDADGIARFAGFERPFDESKLAGLLAFDENGHAAARGCTITPFEANPDRTSRPDRENLGDLILRGSANLNVRVLDGGSAAADATVCLELGSTRVLVAELMTDGDGRARFEHLPAGDVLVRAVRKGNTGRASMILAPARDADLAVTLESTRTIDVQVVDAVSKQAIVGASVGVSESFYVTGGDDTTDSLHQTYGASTAFDAVIAPTDASGHTHIAGIPNQGRYGLWAKADLCVGPDPPGGFPGIPTDADAVVLELHALHRGLLRWPLEPGELAAPADGTILTLRRLYLSAWHQSGVPLPKVARVERGAILVEDGVDRLDPLLAVAPDGSLARLTIADGASEGRATAFRKPRRLDVRVLGADGAPFAGAVVRVWNEGNNPFVPERATDERGEVSFEGLWSESANVFANEVLLGNVDFEKGDARVDGRLLPEKEALVHVRIGQKPQLPATYSLRIGSSCRVLAEDPATGTVRLRFTQDQNREAAPSSVVTKAEMSARGFLWASATLAPGADPDIAEAVIDLHAAGAVLAHVALPVSRRARLRCEPWDESRREWITRSAGGVDDERFTPNAPDDGFLFEDLQAGRYRVRDVDSERASESVDVVPGQPPAQVRLDLADIVRVRGVVEMPEGVPRWYGRVIVEGEDLARHSDTWLKGSQIGEGHYVDGQGRFEAWVSSAHPVTLRAAHPYLSPDPKQGSVLVRGDEGPVFLKLIQGDEVRLPISGLAHAGDMRSLRVYAYDGEPIGEPKQWFCAPIIDGIARFSGLAHGTWTLWIDPSGPAAPIVLRGVKVGEGITSLTLPAPTLGSSIRVRIRHASGVEPPRIYVFAHKQTEPVVDRQWNSNHEDIVALSGLDVGEFDVQVSLEGSFTAELLRRKITVDGSSDVELDVDAP